MCNHLPLTMSRAVLSWVIERLDHGERVALASVIEARGSVPGKPGAKLAISSSGEKFGTVGGAGLEMKIERNLIEMLAEDKSEMRKTGGKIETYILHKEGKGKEAVALDSLCGGQLKVSLEVIEPVPHILIAGGGHVGMSLHGCSQNAATIHIHIQVEEWVGHRFAYVFQPREMNHPFHGSTGTEGPIHSAGVAHVPLHEGYFG